MEGLDLRSSEAAQGPVLAMRQAGGPWSGLSDVVDYLQEVKMWRIIVERILKSFNMYMYFETLAIKNILIIFLKLYKLLSIQKN